MNTATIVKNALPITAIHILDGKQWIEVPVPQGWAQVKKLVNHVLHYNGRDHAFRGWDSDRNVAHFAENYPVALVK